MIIDVINVINDICFAAEELCVKSYCNGLIDQNFVEVGEGDFLAQELDVHRGQRLAGRQRPPMGQLWTEQKVHCHIVHGAWFVCV